MSGRARRSGIAPGASAVAARTADGTLERLRMRRLGADTSALPPLR